MSGLELLAQPMSVAGVVLPNRVFLAPMSGITDQPFRARAAAHGAGLAVSEMVASGELARERRNTALRLRPIPGAIHSVQLAGRDPGHMAEAARIAAGEGADLIDINMGCPAKKVTGGYCGSALMRDPNHALRLIEAVLGAISVPVTLKMRLGWDETALNAPDIARRAEAAGIAMITVHGRTRCQFYEGKADWRAIARVKQAVDVPVVANGDILSEHDAAEVLRLSGADAVMVGRAHYGAPWTAGAIAARASGCAVGAPPPDEIAPYVCAHYEDMLALYGLDSGARQARKHLGWYLDRHAPSTTAGERRALLTETEPAKALASIRMLFAQAAESGAPRLRKRA